MVKNIKYLSQRFKKEFELVSYVLCLQDAVAAKAFQYWVRNSANLLAIINLRRSQDLLAIESYGMQMKDQGIKISSTGRLLVLK